MEFKIGERVRYSDGSVGTITDKMCSEGTGKWYYDVDFDEGEACFCRGDELQGLEASQYIHEIEYLDNLVVVRLYEVKGDEKVEIAKGHGHIFHDGVYGVAQATSYALKRICDDLNGGSLKTVKNY